MYSSVAAARNHLRSAIACLVVGCLFVLVNSSVTFIFAYTLVAPVAPLWLAVRALDRGAYRQALLGAWLAAVCCGLVAALWHAATGPGLFCLAALYFSVMAAAALRRIAGTNS
jgi:hypothetical protein